MIDLDIAPRHPVELEIGALSPVNLRVSRAIDIGGTATPEYDGPYEVTPSENEQTLPAGGLRMRRDVTVYAVPFDLAERQDIDRLF